MTSLNSKLGPETKQLQYTPEAWSICAMCITRFAKICQQNRENLTQCMWWAFRSHHSHKYFFLNIAMQYRYITCIYLCQKTLCLLQTRNNLTNFLDVSITINQSAPKALCTIFTILLTFWGKSCNALMLHASDVFYSYMVSGPNFEFRKVICNFWHQDTCFQS